MNWLFVMLYVGVLSSCSTNEREKSLSRMIKAEEVRSLQEIKSHADFLLESHPELDKKTKSELSALLQTTISKQQALKNEESQIFQLLLEKSFRFNHLSEVELREMNNLKKRLKEVYEEKSKNVIVLINKMAGLFEKNTINDSIRYDMMDLIRDFR